MTQIKSDHWASKVGVILAVAGSAVGLGNFLRFPGQVAQNGGGVFMIPYFIAFLLIGIPLGWAEWTMGKRGGQAGYNSAPGIMGYIAGLQKRSGKGWRFAGALGVLIPVMVYMYYVLIEGWCLAYAWGYLSGALNLGADANQYTAKSGDFFANITGIASDGDAVSGDNASGLVFWGVVFGLNFFLIYRGLTKGIEAFCKWAIPLMSILALVVLVRVLTLGTPNPDLPDHNVINGLGAMWNPKGTGGGSAFEGLLNPQVWLAATGQIFFSLSVGFGVIINYASYLRRKDDVVLSGLTASSTNGFFEVCLGGLITIPAAFIFLGPEATGQGTFGMGFVALPAVFAHMPAGQIFGFLWFFMLFLAAITSSLSMLQPAIAFLEEGFGLKRPQSVALLSAITLSGSGFILFFSKDLMALDTIDFWVGTFLIFVLGMLQMILFGWVWGAKEGVEYANEGGSLKLPKIFIFLMRYVSPAYLLVVFVLWCYKQLPDYAKTMMKGGVPFYSLLFIGACLLALFAGVFIAGKRWDREPPHIPEDVT
jgi:NSS family neurotransmitter:Na+ symporter